MKLNQFSNIILKFTPSISASVLRGISTFNLFLVHAVSLPKLDVLGAYTVYYFLHFPVWKFLFASIHKKETSLH